MYERSDVSEGKFFWRSTIAGDASPVVNACARVGLERGAQHATQLNTARHNANAGFVLGRRIGLRRFMLRKEERKPGQSYDLPAAERLNWTVSDQTSSPVAISVTRYSHK